MIMCIKYSEISLRWRLQGTVSFERYSCSGKLIKVLLWSIPKTTGKTWHPLTNIFMNYHPNIHLSEFRLPNRICSLNNIYLRKTCILKRHKMYGIWCDRQNVHLKETILLKRLRLRKISLCIDLDQNWSKNL